MVPPASSSVSTGRFPGIIIQETEVFRCGSNKPQTTRATQKSKFRSPFARPRRGTDTPICTPTPILPLPQNSLSDAGAVPAVPTEPDLGPRGEGGGADAPPSPETAGETERGTAAAGRQPGQASSREPGAGGGSEPGLPPPPKPERAPGPLPRHRQTKGPTAGDRGWGVRSPASSVWPGRERVEGLFTRRLRAPRLSGSLGPAYGQTDRRTMGHGPQLRPAEPGLSGTGPQRAEGSSGPSRWRGAEGWRCRRTKPTADRQTEGEKMATRAAGARSSRTRSEWGACTSLSSPSPSPLLQFGPPPRSQARARWRGRGLKGKGSREVGLKGASNHRHWRGASPPSSRRRDPPSLVHSHVALWPCRPLSSPILS